MAQKFGRIAFISTPQYRANRPSEVDDFIYRHLYPLCNHFEVISTGRTHEYVMSVVERDLDNVDREAIREGTDFPIDDEADLARWRKTIREGLVSVGSSIEGMIELTYELVEGRLDGIIHLTDWADVIGKPDSMVLRREANVHEVFIASDIHTARAAVGSWLGQLRRREHPIFDKRPPPDYLPLEGLTKDMKVLALIAHDGMKLALCCFVVEHLRTIFDKYDAILTTGTTGAWVKKFAVAAGRDAKEVASKVRLCQSGPRGGDVQIAAAVVRELCQKVIFLQDPFTSHAHEIDILLFEQAVLLFQRAAMSEDIKVELATNVEAAKVILRK